MKMLSELLMEHGELTSTLARAERALQRIERALSNQHSAASNGARDDELRARVREVVEELDELIRQAAA